MLSGIGWRLGFVREFIELRWKDGRHPDDVMTGWIPRNERSRPNERRKKFADSCHQTPKSKRRVTHLSIGNYLE
jgi:hypothetical protein